MTGTPKPNPHPDPAPTGTGQSPDFPGPDSLTWRYLGQWRLMLVIGRALVLETGHPMVGAAVSDYSTYRKHPWRRTEQTVVSLQRQVYVPRRDRAKEYARLRRLHARIHGTDELGRAYSAIDAEAMAWVHLTLYDAMVTMCATGGEPLSPDDEARLYREWRAVAVEFGIPDDVLPRTSADFRVYFDRMVRDVLRDTRGVHQLIESVQREFPPPQWLAFLPDPVWRAVRGAVAKAYVVGTVSMLPSPFREQMPVAVPRGTETVVSLVTRAATVAARHLPVRWAYMPLAATYIDAHRRARRRPEREQPDLAALFARILDRTGDGHVGWSDMAGMARAVVTQLDADEGAEAEVYDAFAQWWQELNAHAAAHRAGPEGDDQVSAAEYAAFVAAGRDHVLHTTMLAVARAADRDGDGLIDRDDYARLLRADIAEVDLRTGFERLDRDRDGRVTLDEFAAALTAYLTGRAPSEVGEHLLGRA
ncbi:oxygenase MpaB family protein [Yinghuangia sp. YIM S09857]|uniref:oxygenase MpaB family protein n=1 Tax=Yinghuangia sp. YIM S09857 TaxID=3436929 RepID=UPI003F538C8F